MAKRKYQGKVKALANHPATAMLQQRGWRPQTAIFGVATHKTGSAYGVPTWRMAYCLSTPNPPFCTLLADARTGIL